MNTLLKNKWCKGLATLTIGMLLSVCPARAQNLNLDSLVRVIARSTSVAAISDAKKYLPTSLSKIDVKILDFITQMRMEGITSSNPSAFGLSKRFSNNFFQVDDQGRILAYLFFAASDPATLLRLKTMGVYSGDVTSTSKQVSCKIPFDGVLTIATDPNVAAIMPVAKAVLNTGTYASAGDGLLAADAARSTWGVSGNGIKIGVISDGVDHSSNSISAGDLPQSFQVLSNGVGGDEGTAMSEIAYDLAPGASLAFHDYGLTEDMMRQNIDYLVNNGCKVIVDDILFPTERVYEDGPLAQAVGDATAANVIYISCAGNQGANSWEGQSVDANSNSWMEFSGSNETNSIVVDNGDELYATLQWANKWNLSGDDYDLFLMAGANPTDSVLASGPNRQTGTNIPFESISWRNTGIHPKTVYLRVRFYSVASPRRVKLVTYMGNIGSLQYTTERAIFGHAAAASCISTAAMEGPPGTYLENFSNHGPSRIYNYDSNGNPTTYVDRATPTVAGIDGVETYVGMSGNWAPYPSGTLFFGTSAAVPHLGGVVALILSANSSLNWQQVKQTLISTCTIVDGMGGQSFTNGYGYGRPDASKALKYVIEHYDATIGGPGTTIVLHENITTTSGTTLTIAAGTSVQLDPNVVLYINGQLIANGSLFHPITFDRSGTSGSWNSLAFQSGSSGTINYCSFTHANTGVTCYSSNVTISNSGFTNCTGGVTCSGSTPTINGCIFTNDYFGLYIVGCNPLIENSTIEYCTNSGIYLTGAAPHIYRNTIRNNSQYGVYCYNSSSPWLDQNTISACGTAGVECQYYSSPYFATPIFAGNNVIANNGSFGVEALYNSNPVIGSSQSRGYNSLFGNGAFDVRAYSYCTVSALYNWWNAYPPNPNRFLALYSSTIDYSNALNYNPNPGRPKISGQESAPLLAGPSSDSTFNLAFQNAQIGNYDVAISLYVQVFNANPAGSLLGKQALLFLAEAYDRSGRTDFINYLQNQISPRASSSTDLVVLVRQLEARWLVKAGKYLDAITKYQGLLSDFTSNPDIEKFALFNIGELYCSYLGDHASAAQSFALFQSKYPSDPLASVATFLMSSTVSPFAIEPQKGVGPITSKVPAPSEFELNSNYPNPFNPSTQIGYSLPEAGNVSLKIYDVLGREIATLADGYQRAGRYTATWNATQGSTGPVSSGVYFARLRVTNDLGGVTFTKTSRLLLLK